MRIRGLQAIYPWRATTRPGLRDTRFFRLVARDMDGRQAAVDRNRR